MIKLLDCAGLFYSSERKPSLEEYCYSSSINPDASYTPRQYTKKEYFAKVWFGITPEKVDEELSIGLDICYYRNLPRILPYFDVVVTRDVVSNLDIPIKFCIQGPTFTIGYGHTSSAKINDEIIEFNNEIIDSTLKEFFPIRIHDRQCVNDAIDLMLRRELLKRIISHTNKITRTKRAN